MAGYKVRSFIVRGLLIVFALSLAACSNTKPVLRNYSGPERPRDQVAELIVPGAIEISSLDGGKFKAPYTGDQEYKISLTPGTHDIKVVYKELWGDPTSSIIVVSDRFKFRVNFQAGATYRLAHNGPEVPEDAPDTEYSINIWLQDPFSGQPIQADNQVAHQSIIDRSFDKIFKTDEDSPMPDQGAIQAEEPPISAAVSADSPTSPGGSAPIPTGDRQGSSPKDPVDSILAQDPLVRLQFWWKLADENQRQAFLDWVKSQ